MLLCVFVISFFMDILSLSLGIVLGVLILGHVVILCLIFWQAINISKLNAPFYNPTGNIWGFLFFYLLIFFNFTVFCVSAKWNFIVILTYIYLMTNENEHLFIYFFLFSYVLYRNVIRILCAFFNWVAYHFIVEL